MQHSWETITVDGVKLTLRCSSSSITQTAKKVLETHFMPRHSVTTVGRPVCGPKQYSKETLLQLATHPLTREPPALWEDVVSSLPIMTVRILTRSTTAPRPFLFPDPGTPDSGRLSSSPRPSQVKGPHHHAQQLDNRPVTSSVRPNSILVRSTSSPAQSSGDSGQPCSNFRSSQGKRPQHAQELDDRPVTSPVQPNSILVRSTSSPAQGSGDSGWACSSFRSCQGTRPQYAQQLDNRPVECTSPEPNFDVETNEEVLSRREKQISYGKNTVDYDRYSHLVCRTDRTPTMPRTPNMHRKYNRRQWDGMVKRWKLKIHQTVALLDGRSS